MSPKSAIRNQKSTIVSWLLVLIQFAALALIALTGPLFAPSPLLLAAVRSLRPSPAKP